MSTAEQLVVLLIQRKLTITTMESCTGGAIINAITSIQGSSSVTEGGYVTYSNAQKMRIGVPSSILETYGVYSQQCATAMAFVVQKIMCTPIAIGVTGTLSNVDPNNADSKQGEVHFCILAHEDKITKTIQIPIMNRSEQKDYIVEAVLLDLLRNLEGGESQCASSKETLSNKM